MAAQLKVFTWSDGFHAYTVATTSRAKALAAWGVTRNLFRDGDASEIDDGPDFAAAVVGPGETIKRGLAVDVGKITSARKAQHRAIDVGRLAKGERELAALNTSYAQAAAEVAEQRSQLEAEQDRLDTAFSTEKVALETRLKAARRKLHI